MAFVRALRALLRDDQVGPRVVPVVSDEARTFGMESLIAEHAIYEPGGQSYTAVDAGLPLHYRESPTGRIFEEGISEAGALATFGAAATSYANNGLPLLPVFLFYSMFGFQRVGDLIWALTDMRARGILAGCTAGRTTLQGEGLQHNDGHSLLLASTNPAVHAYDPTFAYELAVITEAAMSATLGPDPKDYLWYLTLYNENWVMPPFPDNPSRRAQILEGMHLIGGMTVSPYQPTNRHITLLTSGPAYSAVTQAATALAAKGVTSDIWSVTSYGELRNDILATQRYNLLHPTSRPRQPIIARNLSGRNAPVVAVTDHVRALPDLVASASGRPFTSLGTDGFGISDDRPALRAYFAVDAAHVEIAALSALASQGAATTQEVTQALIDHGIDPD
jgi:pyruvate dehydrogenase E1 component